MSYFYFKSAEQFKLVFCKCRIFGGDFEVCQMFYFLSTPDILSSTHHTVQDVCIVPPHLEKIEVLHISAEGLTFSECRCNANSVYDRDQFYHFH